MKNLRSVNALTGYTVRTLDGDIGSVRELYFNDQDWRVKHIVVDTNRWLPGKQVLLNPLDVKDVNFERRELMVSITTEHVRNSPEADTDRPVALQRVSKMSETSNWAMYLAGEALAAVPEAVPIQEFETSNKNGKPYDPHLRTTKVVGGMGVYAKGDEVGHVVDFIVDDDTWSIRYLVIGLEDRRRALLLPELVKDIRFEREELIVDLDAHVLADCPKLDPATLITSQYERAVTEYFHSSLSH
jgi:sporulation protein YlmC with PRC-barrel domain